MNWFAKYKKEIVLALLIFLVATFSFALGYSLARQENRTPIIIEQSAARQGT